MDNGDTVFSYDGSVSQELSFNEAREAIADVDIADLELEYIDYVVTFRVSFEGEEPSEGKLLEVPCKKSYREERGNRFLDMFLSV